jgi:hypothetical protein
VVWAVITVATGYQIGWMAVGVGFLVGFAVRYLGRGIDKSFGVTGAVWSLVGCGAGNLLAVCGLVAKQQNISIGQILGSLNLEIAGAMLAATFSPIDLLFYAIAVYEGYRLSFRRVGAEDIARYTGPAPISGT